MKILIPTLEDKGKESKVSLHFGHAPFLAVYDTEKEKLEIFKNEIDHSNPAITPVDQLMKYKIDMVYVVEIGQKAIDLFREKGVELKTGDFKTEKEVIENLDNLKEIEQGCGH